MTALDWIVGDDTGASSITIWSVMMGATPAFHMTPADPSDFGRCYRLLKLFPEWKNRLSEVAARYPEWTPLCVAWPELEALYEEEIKGKTAPKLYARMRELW